MKALLGDNTGGRAVVLSPIRFRYDEILDFNLTDFYRCMHIVDHVYSIPTRAIIDLHRLYRNVTIALRR